MPNLKPMYFHHRKMRGLEVAKGRFETGGCNRFGRMFPHLRSMKEYSFKVPNTAPGDDQIEKVSDSIGKTTGPMRETVRHPNKKIKSGFAFLGQFIDHDITFDPTSSLEQQNDPNSTVNFRTPALELDSMYGAGPDVQPHLYDRDVHGKFLLSKDGLDVPRTSQQVAIIGEPRNDENLIVNQLHLAFMKFHNEVLANYAEGKFETAQTLVRWHYQWIILHEFLPLTCGRDVVNDILKHGRKFYFCRCGCCCSCEHEPYIPVEFSVAAYRFGHSQIRDFYRVNNTLTNAPIFPSNPNAPLDGKDLRGSQPVTPSRVVQWKYFFGTGPGVQDSMKIDTLLAPRLLNLPNSVVGAGTSALFRSLATRNLVRGFRFSLPSGQTVARYMGIPELTPSQLWGPSPKGAKGDAPLWYYIIREAQVKAKGEHLTGVGARIVAEVLIGLLQCDKASFLNHYPNWRPTLPGRKKWDFSIIDLLRIAKVYR